MKNTITFLTIVLLLWIIGCSYWYVCKIRKDCDRDKPYNESGLSLQTEELKSEENVSQVPAVIDSTDLAVTVPTIPLPDMLTVNFDLGKTSCQLTPQNQSHIDLFKQYLAENPNKMIQVTGHGDNIGSIEANTRVTSARAEFMSQQLLDAGIEKESIEKSFKNDREPIASNNTAEGRAKNRRTEIQIK